MEEVKIQSDCMQAKTLEEFLSYWYSNPEIIKKELKKFGPHQ